MLKKLISVLTMTALVIIMLQTPIATAVAPELITNGDFETIGSNSGASGWVAYSNAWGGTSPVSVNQTEVYSGTKSIKIASSTSNNPFVAQSISVIPGATYHLTAWQKTISMTDGQGPAIKLEFYGSSGSLGNDKSILFSPVTGSWRQVTATFTPPSNSTTATILLRLMGPGEIYWDSVSCIMIQEPPKVFFDTDNFFYYSDWSTGTATLKPNPLNAPPSGTTVDFALKDGATVLQSATGIPLSTGASFTFNVSSLAVLQNPYTVSYVCNSPSGIIAEGSETIYRYNRPTYLDSNGVYTKNGEPILPIIGYNVGPDDYDYCIDAGVNVVQFMPWGTNIPSILSRLDDLQSKNLGALINLYADMKPAGHPDNLAATNLIVNAVKNHPATFGYMLMDEPLLNGVTVEELKNSYKVVRDIDPEHPIYTVECQPWSSGYRDVGKCVDILAIDPYPYGSHDVETNVSEQVKLAVNAVGNKKPVYCINQAVNLGGLNPTSTQLRHMNFQALFAGAKGLGYYTIRDYYVNDGIEHIWERPCWDGVVNFSSKEKDLSYNAFILDNYPVFAEESNDIADVWYISYKAGLDCYVTAINRTDFTKTITVPFMSNGKYLRAEAVYGGNTSDLTLGTNTLSITLASGQASTYRVTPQLIKNSTFESVVSYAPTDWLARDSSSLLDWTNIVTLDNTVTEDGGNCIKIQSVLGSSYAYQTVNWVEGQTYTVTFKFMTTDGANPRIKPEGTTLNQVNLSIPVNNLWTEYTISFTANQTKTVTLLLRGSDGKTAYYDDFRVWSQASILSNGSFETVSGVQPVQWYARAGSQVLDWTNIVTLDNTQNGTNALKIQSVSGSAYAYQNVQWIKNSVYKVTFKFMSPDGANARIKPEGTTLNQINLPVPPSGVWTDHTIYFTAPQTQTVSLLFRGSDGKTAYYDNIEVTEVEPF